MLMSVRKRLCRVFLFCLVFLTGFYSFASSEPLGFGMVNTFDAAICKEDRRQTITRLQKGTCVWIMDSESDSQGELWYHVRTQDSMDSDHPVRIGWIRAELIDAGSRLWNNVQTVKAASFGMIALKRDGTVQCAGNFMFCSPQDRYTRLKGIRQIGFCTVGNGFFAVDGRGRLYRDGIQYQAKNRIRLAGSSDLLCITEDNSLQVTSGVNTRIRWVYPQSNGETLLPHVVAMADCGFRSLFLTDDGKVYCAALDDMAVGYPEPDWEAWTDVVSIDASLCSCGACALNGQTPGKYVPAFAAVRQDGKVLAAPEELAALTADWQDILKVAVGADWILGLKQDGTVLAAGIGGSIPPDVSGWTDITDISNGHTYCIGVKQDRTLVFAGDFPFADS